MQNDLQSVELDELIFFVLHVALCRRFLIGRDIRWRLLLVSGNTEVHLRIMLVLIPELGMRSRFAYLQFT